MNFPLWIILGLCFSQTFASSCICDENPNCAYPDNFDFEIHCDVSNPPLVIHVRTSQNEIVIECPDNLTSLQLNEFPNISVNNVENFTMKYCVWMTVPFYKIFERFHLSEVTALEFSVSRKRQLTADLFKNLLTLQSLILSQNEIEILTENVFEFVPNLLELDLQNNNIVLTKNVFKTIPLLKFLDLSGNKLRTIPSGVFQPLSQLKVLHLWDNRLTKLDGRTFQGLFSLRSLEMSYNQIEEVTHDAFHDLDHLTEVNFLQNELKRFPVNLFQHNKNLKLVRLRENLGFAVPAYFLANTSVIHVDFRDCKLRVLPALAFTNAFNLQVVNLMGNQLKVLPKGIFTGLNLKRIFLQNNEIEFLDRVFEGLANLKGLFLQNNLIAELPPEVFADLVNLERINLQQNKITSIHPELFARKKKLKSVNLSFNQIITPLQEIIPFRNTPLLTVLNVRNNNISTIKLEHLRAGSTITIKLDFNNISVVDFHNVNTSSIHAKISMRNNSIVCDCRNYKLIKHLKSKSNTSLILRKDLFCHAPLELKDKNLIDLSFLPCPLEQLSKNSTMCPKKCDCSCDLASPSILVNCSNRNLTEFPKIDLSELDFWNQTEGWFQGNDLKEGPKKSQGYEKMTKLYLSHNKIRQIDWLPPRLEVLALDHNHITNLKEEVVRILDNSSSLTLSLEGNPWVCDCGSESLANFLRNSKNLNFSADDVTCVNRDDSLLNLKESDLCLFRKKHVISILILSLLLIVAVTIALYYRYQKSIKIWLFSKNLCLWFVTEEELDRDKTYDAFISYIHKDEVVVSKIVQVLETPPENYKLCVHYRDWVPGEFITEQITKSVLQSRRTIVILSKHFLESVWGKMEFRTAHTQAMSDGRTRVIIILYGDININDLDEELKMYLKTNTYVKWDDPYFWEKLKYALPHKARKCGGLRFANTMMPNEEARLIDGEPTTPGSTPPISLNHSFTKIDPLSLV